MLPAIKKKKEDFFNLIWNESLGLRILVVKSYGIDKVNMKLFLKL